MTDAPDSPFDELRYICSIEGKALVRYTKAFNLLQRLCLAEAEEMRSDFTSLFSLLSAVCRKRGIDYRPADRFRRVATRVMRGLEKRSPETEKNDFAGLSRFISDLTGEAIPADLPHETDTAESEKRPTSHGSLTKQRCDRYATILSVEANDRLRCRLADTGEEVTVHLRHDTATPRIAKDDNDPLPSLKACSYPDATVMLLDAQEESTAPMGEKVLSCYQVIIEPDYLIDVTSLTATLKPYGRSPLNYLLNLLTPNIPTRYTLLGNLAGRFMDDLIRGKANKRTSMLNDFRENILEYICLSDREIGPDYFMQADRLYDHIAHAVRETFASPEVDMAGKAILIEPSFICPSLGLRGRFDAMTADSRKILELKSGRADEADPAHPRPKAEHLLQMALYGEMMRRNCSIGWDDLQTFLFYARYPRFYSERPSASGIRDILSLRNGIVFLIHYLAQRGLSPLLPRLTTEALNRTQLHTTFYSRFLRPQLDAATGPLTLLGSDPLLRSYLDAFLSFILRESLIGKTLGKRPDSLRGFSATWHADLHRKRLAGNILDGLTPQAVSRDAEGTVSHITFSRARATEEEAIAPNFAPGEMVQLYDATEPDACVSNRQLFRGTLIDLTHERVTIALAHSQTDDAPFADKRRFSIEHDTTDAPMHRNLKGLFSLLTAPADRRDLILGRRSPQADITQKLIAPCDKSIAPIILGARQARDYYLLVGPPGSGKTNFAMKAMVREYLHTIKQHREAARNEALMLTAYTNRAVDEICSMLEGLCKEEPFNYLRIGNPQTCATAYRHRLLGEQAATLANRTEARKLFDTTPIIVGTVLTLSARQLIFRRKRFRTAIIDEASQLLEPQLLSLLCATTPEGKAAIGKFVLIGDHKQLPAVVELPSSQTRATNPLLREMGLTDLSQALFQRLHAAERRAGRTAFTGLLSRQGRMHAELGAYVSKAYYDGHLTPVPLPHQTAALPWRHAESLYERFVATTRMGFIPIEPDLPMENVQVNAPEALAVASLVEAICSLSLKTGHTAFHPEEAIGIIVPFRGQIGMIRNTLRRRGYVWTDQLTIDTVECYQGSQRDFIIFSTTISEPHQLALLSQPQTIEGTAIDRKLNVALTRARLQFFLVGNPILLARSPAYADLIRHSAVLSDDSAHRH